MKRRNFLTGLAAMSAIPAFGFSMGSDENQTEQKFIEILKYQLPFGPSKERVSNFYKDAAITALNKAGVSPVGVFNVAYGPDSLALYVIQQHKNFESVITYNAKLMDDKDFRLAAKEYLETPFANPAYLRIETSLLKGFKDMPTLEQPTALLSNMARIYEMRIYESHSYLFGQKKIEMFNEGGEIKVFRKTGLVPVMFGETMIGKQIPNLTYMLVFENMTERDKKWDIFRADPDWEKLRNDPQYKDTVSCITDIILKPTAFSQL